MKMFGYVMGYILVGILALSFMYGVWQLGRIWNYNLSYKSMVEQTVRDMVKDESLKGD